MNSLIDPQPSLTFFGNPDHDTIKQINECLKHQSSVKGVLCGDAHKGYSQPVGGVVAYRNSISISGVGFDIACGNFAIKTDAKWGDISKHQKLIADQMVANIAFGVGRKNPHPVDHALFDDERWKIKAIQPLKQLAREQLGTIGSSNHFVDIFSDDHDSVWIGVHFGSRGFGHKTASHFLLVSGGQDGMDVPPTVVDENSSIGSDYIACMELAGLYAYAGREYVCDVIAKNILKANIIDEVHNHHNFAWKENHFGEDLWVVRKGATPAFPGQRGFVGGSMGDISVILHGIESEKSKENLYSTVHGAGRIMSRTKAAGKVKWKKGEDGKKRPVRVSEGLINEHSMRQKIKNQGIELRGAGPDEAPDVYRRLNDVLDCHAGTIEIETRLYPKIVVMAGSDEYDPYKD